jgi:hypothetical protein
MKVVKLSQEHDRESWLDLRRDKITGTRVKSIKPLIRGTDKTPVGFWEMLADRFAIAKDGEPASERGLRLQGEAMLKTEDVLGLDLDTDPGFWVSDIDEDIAVSPDGAENSKTPKYAVEAKCYDSKNHLRVVLMDMRARESNEYRAFDQIPKDDTFQVLQYFVVNEKLEKLYYTLYDDRFVLDKLIHHVITIERKHIEKEIKEQLDMELDVLEQLRENIKEVKKYVN